MHSGLSPQPEASAFAALDRRLLRNQPTPVAIALSGGGDSLALLRLARAWADAAGRPLLALTVDHGLNPASAEWTTFAGERAAESGAAFRALAWTGEKPRAGLPAAARAARHALLATAAREAGAAAILLGHTADDVAETEIMRGGDAPGIGRLREWSPSPAWPQGDGVFLLRPLLGMGRASLRQWLASRGERWIDDPANADLRYARIRARQHPAESLQPPEPPDEAAVAGLAAQVIAIRGGGLQLPRSPLLQAEPAVQRRVLSAALLCAAGCDRPPRTRALDRLLGCIAAAGPAQTLAGARIASTSDAVRITCEPGDRRRRSAPPCGEGVRDAEATGRRFRAATFQIADEGALRTTSWP